MAVPTLTPLPPAPTPSDSPVNFASKSGTFVSAEVVFVNEMNTNVIPAINTTSQQVHDDAVYAGQAADRAEAVDTNVSEQVAAATAAANNARASAAAAEAAPGSIGNLALIQAMALLF